MRIFQRWMLSILLLLPLYAPAEAPALPSIDDPVRTDQRAPDDAGLVIGIETYLRTGVPPVPYARRDAQVFYDFLVSTRGVPAERVRIIQDNASAAMIRREVAELGRRVGPEGVAWVYFAGHGGASLTTTERMLLGDDVMNDPREFDNGGVPMPEIERLAGAGGGEVVMVVDACDTGVSGRDLVPGYFKPEQARTVLWSATGPGEVAAPLDLVRHGAFTYFALGALRGWADGEVDDIRDGKVTAGEAQLYVARALRTAQLNGQTPEVLGRHDFVMDAGVGEKKPAIPPPGRTGGAEARPVPDQVEPDERPPAPRAGTLAQWDFEQTAQDGWTTASGQWVHMDGRLAQNSGDRPARILAGNDNWTDYAIEFDAQKIDGAEGIVVDLRATDKAGALQWVIGGWGNRFAKLEVIDTLGANTASPIESTSTPVALQAGRTYHVRVEARGAHVTGWVDRAKLLDVTHPEIALRPSGRIGLATWSTRAWFDNVVVSALPPSTAAAEQASPATTPATLLAADFTDGKLTGWAPARADWLTMDGRLAQNGGGTPSRILAGSDIWTDYAIDFDMQKIEGSDGIFVDFRFTDSGGGMQWVLGGWGNRFAKLEVIDGPNANGARPMEATSTPLALEPGRTYHVRLEVRGSHATGWVGATRMLDVSDPEIALRPAGRIGLGTWDTRAWFDNVVVTRL